MQEVALVDVQESEDDWPLYIDDGVAFKSTVGAGVVTVTLAESEALPPAPVQVKV